MKITSIKPYLYFPGLAKNLLYVRVETDCGIYGWGEAYVVKNKEMIVSKYVEMLEPYLIGHSPYETKHMENALFCDYALKRASFDFIAAWSAIEMAMWDIKGKDCGQPVYNLLGGKVRDKVRVYANGWWGGCTSPEMTAERAKAAVDMGYTAIKWDPFQGYWREFVTQAQEDYAVECVKQVREAVGPKVDLLIELHRRFAPYYAIHFSERIEEYKPTWIEEPCLADNLNLVREVKEHIKTPVVTGETLYRKQEFIPVFENKVADIINPDIGCCGGVTGLMEIAAMAEPYSVIVSPHNYNSTSIALAATGHCALAFPNFNITEVFITIQEPSNAVTVEPLKIENGFLTVPDKPGFGLDLDMKVLESHPYSPFKSTFPFAGAMDYKDEYPREGDFIL